MEKEDIMSKDVLDDDEFERLLAELAEPDRGKGMVSEINSVKRVFGRCTYNGVYSGRVFGVLP